MGNYQQPGISSPEDKIVWPESNGATLLFFPSGMQHGVKTAHGEADAVQAKIVRLNDGRVWENALVFPTALVTQIKGAIPDGMVLGILGQGENTKGNPPWLLRPYTEADVAMADAWMAQNPRFSQPAQQEAPAAAPAWGQQAPATPAPTWGQQQAPAAPAPAWGAPAAAPAPAAPAPAWGQQNAAQAGWGAPAAPQAPAAGGWGQQAAPAPAAPADPPVDPGLLAALAQRGIVIDPATPMSIALQAAATVGLA